MPRPTIIIMAFILVLSCGPRGFSQTCEKDIKAMRQSQRGVHERLSNLESVNVGGAIRMNYVYEDWDDENKRKGGEFRFELFRLSVDGCISDLIISGEYRWYSYMEAIHHGFIAYDFSEHVQIQTGVVQAPFGILPYASHSYWFGSPFYLGLEDDYDMGVKAIINYPRFNVQAAFFKNDEWGDPTRLGRYSFDVVEDLGQNNHEVNQGNLRFVYSFLSSGGSEAEVGASLQVGQLYNSVTEEMGGRYAAAVHANIHWDAWNVMLEAVRYEYDPANPAGVSDDYIVLGGYMDSFPAASRAWIYVANVAYSVPVSWGPVTKLTFYNDYSRVVKDERDGGRDFFEDSELNVTGCLVKAGPVYAYVDFYMGRNMIWLGPRHNGALAEGARHGDGTLYDGDLHTRFNINIGYYF